MFIAALFTTAKNGNNLNPDKWKNLINENIM
jgi:hypothetical protein